MPAIMESNSVREALLLLYRPAGAKRKPSLTRVARKLGYKSSRLLEMILKGDRAPSSDLLTRTAVHFSLSEPEQQLMELLALKERLERAGRSSVEVNRRLARLRKKVVSVRFVEPQFFTLVSDWYCFVIKQLLRAYPDGLSISMIVTKLRGRITEIEAQRAVHTLLHLEIVGRGEDPRLFVLKNSESIYTRPDIPSTAVRKHHRQNMERAIQALEQQSVFEREIISLTFPCPAKSLPRLKELLRRFRDEIDSEFGEPSPSIMQLNLQLFSQTK